MTLSMANLATYIAALAFFALSFAASSLGVFVIWYGQGWWRKAIPITALILYFILVVIEPPPHLLALLVDQPFSFLGALRQAALAVYFCFVAREVAQWLKGWKE